MMAFRVASVVGALLFTACCTVLSAEFPHIRQLSEPVLIADPTAKNGGFPGLNNLGRGADGKFNLNVLLVHGIGWTQDAQANPLGHDLVETLSNAHGVNKKPFGQSTHLCPQSQRMGSVAIRAPAGGVKLNVPQSIKFSGDDVRTPFDIWVVGCLDKTRIDVADGTITIYRLIWDDEFYNAFDYPLVGYDDRLTSGHEQGRPGYGGYENLASLRRPGTSDIRDSVLTYGMTDAALYMGPVGKLMRSAVAGAICAAVNDATGSTREFDKLDEPGRESPYIALELSSTCQISGKSAPTPFAIVAESLGSRMVFDVLSRERNADLARTLERVSGGELMVYLIANQIPLLAAARLSPIPSGSHPAAPAPTDARIRYVAFTDVDDLLSYELVPYFEHLAYLRCRLRDEKTRELQNPECGASDPEAMVRLLKNDKGRRNDLVRDLGFDVVDVRVKFSPPIFPLYPRYGNYQEAHTGYLRDKTVRRAIICGAAEGKLLEPDRGKCR
jgi:hypothetical protein